MNQEPQRPSNAQLATAIGKTMFLIPVILVLLVLLAIVVIAGGWYGGITLAVIVGLIAFAFAKRRR